MRGTSCAGAERCYCHGVNQRALLAVLVLSGCYRDTAAPIENTARPPARDALVQQRCGGLDDLAQPPLDIEPQRRLRMHSSGVLSGASGRTWAGAPRPDFVPARLDTLELWVLDSADGGYLALYREPYDLTSCTLGGAENCQYVVRWWDGRGTLRWSLPLGAVLSRADHLEVQDLRLVDGVLYFNEACQSYAREAQGQCSSLVAVDPVRSRVLWRTQPLVSNGRFRVRGCYLIAGYGFTAERDNVFLVDRATGAVVQKVPVSSSPERLTLDASEHLDVELYSGITRRFRLDGMDAPNGRIVALDADPGFGGAGYGGAAYGGTAYGSP